jgi:8-oxo-dGTP pyrophosphatase MutT (NUDIX family)
MGYVRELRALVGNRPLVVAGANVLILDDANRVLLQRRADTGLWAIVGGAMEPGETLEETARREVREEIGVELGNLTLVDVFSGAAYLEVYPNGDQVYPVGAVYLTYQVHGEPVVDEREVMDLRFFALDALPSNLANTSRLVLERCRDKLRARSEGS